MEDFNILLIFAIVLASIIMIILSIFIVLFGKLIEDTPDGREIKGIIRDEKSINAITAPKNIVKVYAGILIIVFVIGEIILLLSGESKVLMIIGGVIMFAALLFSATVVIFEMMIYNTMKNQMKGVV
jgi:hypothetical protein